MPPHLISLLRRARPKQRPNTPCPLDQLADCSPNDEVEGDKATKTGKRMDYGPPLLWTYGTGVLDLSRSYNPILALANITLEKHPRVQVLSHSPNDKMHLCLQHWHYLLCLLVMVVADITPSQWHHTSLLSMVYTLRLGHCRSAYTIMLFDAAGRGGREGGPGCSKEAESRALAQALGQNPN